MIKEEPTAPALAEVGMDDLRELLHQREGLRQVIELISGELELRPLLTQIVRAACELLEADMGMIGLVDETKQAVRIEAVYGVPVVKLGLEVSPGVGLSGQILLNRQPLIVDRYADLEQPLLPELADYAMVGVPICWCGPMIGFFGVGAAPPRRFSPQHAEILALFARHAAIAIENARLYEAEKRRANHIAIINRVGRLVSSSLHLDQLLQTAVEAIAEYLHYPYIAILLVDTADRNTLVLRAGSGIYKTSGIEPYRQSIDQGIIGAAARTRRPRLVNNVRRDPCYLPVPGAGNVYAELAVPIIAGDRLLGVLNIESREPIGRADAEGFEIIADQLGGAIDNARLFAETRTALDHARLLYETSQQISTAMGVDEVIRVYLEQVAARGRYACHIVLYEFNDAGERLAAWVRGRWTPEEGLVLYLKDPLPGSPHLFDPLLDAGQLVTIPEVQEEKLAPLGRTGRQSLALISLLVRERRIGLVILSHPAGHTWPESDLQPYRATAAQLATAIDHRQQYHLLYERGRQIAVLQERQRLARELHDSVTQLIFSVTLIAQSISPAWRRDPAEGERRIGRLLELSQLALVEMRALLTELRPDGSPQAETCLESGQLLSEAPVPGIVKIQQDGLLAVLSRHLADVARDGLEVEFDPAGYVPQHPAHEEALYRITQEALNNVVKHAQARRVTVSVTSGSQGISLTVTDDGIGFSAQMGQRELSGPGPARSGMGGGFGLTNMRERAAALGGAVQVMAAPKRGTTVSVTIPRKDRVT